MGKWLNYRVHLQYKEDLKVDRGHEMDKFLKHVPHIANTFPRNSMAIGCLDINDLIQAGNVGLTEAWNKVDWDRIANSTNPQGELWSFLKIRIKFAIRQEINTHANAIRIPTRDLKKASKELKAHDKILVDIFPKFFGRQLAGVLSDGSTWRSIKLEELIVEELERKVKNVDHRDMLLKFYGVGFDKVSMKDLATMYNKNTNAIGQIIHTTKKKLNNEDFRKIIENFDKEF